ncbi:MAG: hypothetical protein KDA86_21135 [Planctomycetaceae bacterium]|nr:hypothetical protein [Planctomycetaceae bacterium]
MSDDLSINSQQADLSVDEFEEISSDEVDRVVEALEGILATVESENIQAYLEEAINQIFTLVYDEEDLEAIEDDIQDEAA